MLAITPRWRVVAKIISERLGKVYGGDYVQQVSAGTRTNTKVEAALRDIGFMQDQLSTLTAVPTKKGARSGRVSQVAA